MILACFGEFLPFSPNCPDGDIICSGLCPVQGKHQKIEVNPLMS